MAVAKRQPDSAPPSILLGEHNAVTPSLNDGDMIAPQYDASGNLLVNVIAGGGSGSNAAAGQTGAAVPTDADYQGVSIGGTLQGQTGLSLNTGAVIAATVAVVDASGTQVTSFGGSGGNAAASATGAAVPADADYVGFNSGGNLVGVSSSNPLPITLANTGANSTAVKVDGSAVTQPVSAASLPLPTGAATAAKQPALGTAGSASADVISIQGIASMTAVKVDGSGVTQPVSAASLPLPTGASTAAKQPALGTAGTASADVISIQGIASMTAVKVDGSGVTQPVSLAANGTLPYSASVNATKAQVKGSAGTVFGWSILNTTSAIAYCQVFDKASASVTVGTTAPDYVIPIPANSTTGAGSNIFSEKGWSHANGITIACTTTRTGSTNAACDVLIFYS